MEGQHDTAPRVLPARADGVLPTHLSQGALTHASGHLCVAVFKLQACLRNAAAALRVSVQSYCGAIQKVVVQEATDTFRDMTPHVCILQRIAHVANKRWMSRVDKARFYALWKRPEKGFNIATSTDAPPFALSLSQDSIENCQRLLLSEVVHGCGTSCKCPGMQSYCTC